jgi:hypothetical protein
MSAWMEAVQKFFKRPIFPPCPNLGHVIPRTEGPYTFVDEKGFRND